MAKHSKRHNIRHKKAITDAKKSKIYAKVGKIIEIAARKGTDPSMNPSLQLALAKARYNGLPREVIDKAVKKGAGQSSAEQFEEISYEGYGPNGSAVLVKALTSNRNRTSGSVRLYFSKYAGSIAEPGAVAWQFVENGQIIVDGYLEQTSHHGKKGEEIRPFDPEQLELQAIERGVNDIHIEDGQAILVTSREDFGSIVKQVEQSGLHIISAELVFQSENQVTLTHDQMQSFDKLIEALEDDDDIDTVRDNVSRD